MTSDEIDEIPDHDTRQLARMLAVIADFREGGRSLDGMLVDLEVLHGCLTRVSREWSDRFTVAWGALEQINAWALNLDEPVDPRVVAEALQRLQEVMDSDARVLRLRGSLP